MESHTEMKARDNAQLLQRVGDELTRIRDELVSGLPGFVSQSSGPTVSIREVNVRVMTGIVKQIDYSLGFTPTFAGSLVGNEVLVREESNGTTVFRREISRFEEEKDSLKKVIRTFLLKGLAKFLGQQ